MLSGDRRELRSTLKRGSGSRWHLRVLPLCSAAPRTRSRIEMSISSYILNLFQFHMEYGTPLLIIHPLESELNGTSFPSPHLKPWYDNEADYYFRREKQR